MSRIGNTFRALKAQEKTALIPFITAGDPDPELTVPILHALVAAGADIIEMGVPFSDPMADGPTIQRASERALHYGVGLKDVLAMVAEFRGTNSTTPIVLMGYANPIERMGYAAFAAQAAAAGVDGVLTVDIPPEECIGLADALAAYSIDMIFLLSPTTPASRIKLVAQRASGFVYYVSLKGVTGSANLDLDEVASHIPVIRERCGMPVGVGFGIRDAATAHSIAQFADAVVIGSRIVQEIENSPREQLVDNLSRFVRSIRVAMDTK